MGVHLFGGIWGSLAIGLFATKTANELGGDGLFSGGGLSLLVTQTIGVLIVMIYSFVVTFIIGKVLDKTIGFRADRNDEVSGIDFAEHRETAYESLVGAKL